MRANEIAGAGRIDITEPNWYAVYTRHSHEKRVGDHFSSRNIEFFLPQYRTTHRWRNRCKVELELPLFPSYIFARVAWSEHVRVLEVPSVISIVSNRRAPTPLCESEIDALRSSLTHMRAQPHPYLNVGARVHIKSGPLAGMEGIVLRDGNGLRVVLTVELIMKSIVVEVEQWDLENVPQNS